MKLFLLKMFIRLRITLLEEERNSVERTIFEQFPDEINHVDEIQDFTKKHLKDFDIEIQKLKIHYKIISGVKRKYLIKDFEQLRKLEKL